MNDTNLKCDYCSKLLDKKHYYVIESKNLGIERFKLCKECRFLYFEGKVEKFMNIEKMNSIIPN